jgi:hypothetical protein
MLVSPFLSRGLGGVVGNGNGFDSSYTSLAGYFQSVARGFFAQALTFAINNSLAAAERAAEAQGGGVMTVANPAPATLAEPGLAASASTAQSITPTSGPQPVQLATPTLGPDLQAGSFMTHTSSSNINAAIDLAGRGFALVAAAEIFEAAGVFAHTTAILVASPVPGAQTAALITGTGTVILLGAGVGALAVGIYGREALSAALSGAR